MKFFITFCLLSLVSHYVSCAEWTHNEADTYGPSKWKDLNPTCGGRSQTPINIDIDTVKCTRTSLSIRYLKHEIESVKIKNDGHGFVFLITWKDKTPRILRWSDDKGKKFEYVFHSAHYHWGGACTGGSEHTIDGHRGIAELHLVHYNTKYKSLGEAVPNADGLAVLGVILELADNSTYNAWQHANRFIKYLPEIPEEGNEYTIPIFDQFRTILDLIKYDVKDFYSYQGSLTTPPCAESVRWLVSARPIRLYPFELEKFQEIIEYNYRPLQPLNGRTIIGSCA